MRGRFAWLVVLVTLLGLLLGSESMAGKGGNGGGKPGGGGGGETLAGQFYVTTCTPVIEWWGPSCEETGSKVLDTDGSVDRTLLDGALWPPVVEGSQSVTGTSCPSKLPTSTPAACSGTLV